MPVADLQHAVEKHPASAEAHFALAAALRSEGRLAEAAGEWVAGLQIDPRSESAHLSLADALLDLKLFPAAAIASQQALMVAPNSAEAYDRLARAVEAQGDRAAAIEHYMRSLSLRPRAKGTSHRLAAALRSEGRLESARRVLQGLCDANARDAGSRFLLAGVLADMGSPADAIRELRKAISLQPQFPEALNNLAILLRAAGQMQEAEVHFRKALTMRPAYAAAWNNLANLCVELSRLEEAWRCYTKAVAIDPEYAEAHTNRALVALLKGQFEEGWREYEWRWKQPGVGPRVLAKPEWDGSPIAGKTILLHSEQGAGDTIQFIRYARLLRQQGATVLAHCQDSLKSLLSGMPDLAAVFSGPMTAPDFDVHAPLMSLPRLFETGAGSIPGNTPYLEPVPGCVVPQELASAREFRVGIVWAGNASHRNDHNRSVALELWDNLTRTTGARFFSFQVGLTLAHEEWLRERSIFNVAPHLADYAATAACLSHIDLLISVDTSVAHLAGALGKPVWTLLPACNDWRWLQDREDSPWYPSMRLFRQTALRNWRPVVDRVTAELQRELEKK